MTRPKVKEAAEPAAPTFVPKRGRPTRKQVAAIDATILEAARNLFLSEGYASTSMEAVANAVGVSKGTLYARYPAKSELFQAIANDRLKAWGAGRPTPDDNLAGEVGEQLFRFGVAFLEGFRNPEIAAFDRLITAEAARFPELAESFYKQGYYNAVDVLARNIETLTRRAGWPVADARGVALAFTSGLVGWWRNESLLHPVSEEESSKYVALQVKLLVGGRAAW